VGQAQRWRGLPGVAGDQSGQRRGRYADPLCFDPDRHFGHQGIAEAPRLPCLHDPLTKLPNRLLFNERLDHACQLAKRDRRRLAVIFVDLDRFKNINDSLGHQIGDKLLIASARRLTNLLRASDTIARLGGDEFIILLEDIDDPQAIAMLCSNLLAAFEAPFSIDDHSLHITPSMGISCSRTMGKMSIPW